MTRGEKWDKLPKKMEKRPSAGMAFVYGGICVKHLLTWLKGEPVLLISALCALLSMFLTPPSAAYLGYIDQRVLILLFSLMAVVAGLQDCGLFEVLAQKLLAGRRRMKVLKLLLVMLPFFTSMLVTNDVALLTFVPFAVLTLGLVGRSGELLWVVVLQTLAANLGSMATPVGNPQNLYLYNTYSIAPGQFFAVILPLTLVSFVALSVACLVGKDETIEVHFPEKAALRRPGRMGLLLLLFVLCLLCVFHVVGEWVLLAVVLIALLIAGRDLLSRVDYGLLATFVCFFVFAGNIGAVPALREGLTQAMSWNAALVSGLASQVISNVPAALLLSGFTDDWRGLLLGTDIGGLGTPVASLASLISLKLYLRTQNANGGRYLLIFTLANVAGLLLLGICGAVFASF